MPKRVVIIVSSAYICGNIRNFRYNRACETGHHLDNW